MKKILLAAGVSFAVLGSAGAFAAKTEGALWSTPEGVTMQALGKAQGFDLGKQTAAFLAREQIAYTNAKGMTLYTYAKDLPGKPMCADDCTATWKPFAAQAGAKPEGAWSIIARADGAKQWALQGKPLYTYVKDVDPGSVAGNSPARSGARRIDGAGHPVGGGVRGSGGRGLKDEPMPEGWQPALAFPVADMMVPDGIAPREVVDANAIVLVNYKNQTLYTFEGQAGREPKGDVWTPAAAPQFADPVGDFAFVVRADGIKQWTYKGKGLYTYANDFSADDAYGIGVDKQWKVAAVANYYIPASVMLYNTPGQGKILAAAAGGMTLYKRDGYILQSGGGHSLRRGQPQRPAVGRDIGVNALCDADCQKVWHPFLASADAQPRGFWNTIARADGTKQWVYQGYALWTYDGDKKPGDMTGNDSMQYAFADTPSMVKDENRKMIDLGTPNDGAPALYWAIAIP